LEEKTNQYDQLVISVQKEKEEIEIILAEVRRDKKNVEAAYANLESQIEELQVTKRSKFMCF
jgi:t-SNARE complex subunit (syntaxin)